MSLHPLVFSYSVYCSLAWCIPACLSTVPHQRLASRWQMLPASALDLFCHSLGQGLAHSRPSVNVCWLVQASSWEQRVQSGPVTPWILFEEAESMLIIMTMTTLSHLSSPTRLFVCCLSTHIMTDMCPPPQYNKNFKNQIKLGVGGAHL